MAGGREAGLFHTAFLFDSPSALAATVATDQLDPNAYVRDHLDQAVLDAGPSRGGTVGIVHLQVGDVDVARQFYVDTLGFEVTQSGYPGALFVAAGGYHHHVGLNAWRSAGAGPRAASLGLGTLAITVPGRDDLDALAERLSVRGLGFADDGRSVTVDDPWRTQVTVSLPGAGVDELLAR